MNNRIRMLVAAAAIAVLLGAAMTEAHENHGRNVSTRSRGPVETCADLEITYDHWETARAEETRTVARSTIATLEIPTRRNSGVQVLGWDRDEYSITACKAAGARTQEAAAKLLAQVRHGNYRLRAQNGPLNVRLTGTRWEGDLDATTRNGPINLEVPENYVSAVRVEASGHSPMSCRAAQCKRAVRTWEHPNRIEFGSGDPVVRISTVNGPVHVE